MKCARPSAAVLVAFLCATFGAPAILAAPPFVNDPSWTFESNRGSAWFGYSIASAGDVNGDGYDDVIVGAPYDGTSGSVFVFHGSATGLNPSTWQWTASGEGTDSRFGWSVAGAGDVNGDGYDDVIVGAPNWSNGTGRVYVYLGSASGLQASPAWITVLTAYGISWNSSQVGFSVAGAGDVNGDGYADIVVGAPYFYRATANSSGGVFVWLGGPGGLGANGTQDNADWWQPGQANGDLFGFSVAAAGDVNKDGRGDIIAGAPGYGEPDAGRAYVFMTNYPNPGDLLYPPSGSGVDLYMGWCALPFSAPSQVAPGYAVAGAGDLNGDGAGDVAIGLPYGSQPGPQVKVWLGPGTTKLPYQWTADGNATLTAPSADALGRFGFALAGVGDVDGDGRADLAIADARPVTGSPTMVDAERVFLFRGVAGGVEAAPAWTSAILNEDAMSLYNYYLPRAVAGRGDVDGDGFPDLLAGLPYYSNTPPLEGRAFMWRGGAQPLSVQKAGSGTGYVSSNPAGVACGADCGETYNHRTAVTLTASPDASSNFTTWSGDCAGTSSTCALTMNGPRNATANFDLKTFLLTVSRAGTGSGTVTSSPAGIDCGADCSEVYTYGTTVGLTATPAAGSVFRGWSGDAGCGPSVYMTASRTCTATFDILLTVNKTGTGTGLVTSSPPGIDCGADCQEAYTSGAAVALTAAPDAGCTFSGWSGDADCLDGAVTMTASRTCIAAFNQGTGWVVRENTTATGDDTPLDIGADAAGNVYVVSTRCPQKNASYNCLQQDIVTTKYDAQGQRLWYDIYDGPAAGQDYSRALALDGSGNVVVTGSSESTVGNYDYVVIKYSPDGQRSWVRRYDGSAHTADVPADIAVDAQGNVIVTGASSATNGNDYTTLKYSPAGDLLWTSRYNGPAGATSDDRPAALALDSGGGVRVGGHSSTTDLLQRMQGDLWDYDTVAYDSAGSPVWDARYDGPQINIQDSINAVAVDPLGYTAVTGGSGNDAATLRYDAAGQQAWVQRRTSATGAAIAADASGNVYVGGTASGTNGGDFLVLRYTAAGAVSWERTFNGSGNGYDTVKSIALAPDGTLYLAGTVTTGTWTDIETMQYDAGGTLLWQTAYNGPASLADRAMAMAIGPEGNVYVAGSSCAQLDAQNICTRYDMVTFKYSRCLDTDGDGICNFSDPDDDNDGVPDASDCAPLDPAYSSPPPEVSGVALAGGAPTPLAWTCGASTVTYDLASGTLSALRGGGGTSGATCLAADLTACGTGDARPGPSPGDGYYYMVRAAHACIGSYGSATGGTERKPAVDCP